jgi:hypothetical protein
MDRTFEFRPALRLYCSYAAVLVVFTSASNALTPDNATRVVGNMNSTLH